MGVRDAILYGIDQARAVTGPSVVDVRPTSVSVITRVWNGARRGIGSATDSTPLALAAFTPVRHVTLHEVASSGGLYEEGDVKVGPITPQYTRPDGSLGGFTAAQVAPADLPPGLPPGTEIIYRLALQSGQTGLSGDYSLVEFRRDHTYRFDLILRRRRDTP